jgi:hypothetical protein
MSAFPQLFHARLRQRFQQFVGKTLVDGKPRNTHRFRRLADDTFDLEARLSSAARSSSQCSSSTRSMIRAVTSTGDHHLALAQPAPGFALALVGAGPAGENKAGAQVFGFVSGFLNP